MTVRALVFDFDDLRLASFEEVPLAELLARVDGTRVPGPAWW
jgi:hypothetical protein